MWRSVGTVNPQEPKHNRSRDESNYQPFAQASRLKLNQSHLSGQGHQQQFMNQYFVKKRSSEGMLQRVLSQKNIQTRPFVSPPASLRDVESPRIRLKSEAGFHGENSLKQIAPEPKFTEARSLVQEVSPPKDDKLMQVVQSISGFKKDLASIKIDQSSLKKSVGSELESFRKGIHQLELEIKERFDKLEVQKEQQKKEGINPQLLNRIREESMRFSEKMRQIDNRKDQVREKYKRKLQNV